MVQSKLPNVGTTIFTVMSRLATELGAVNLGQGFPDYPIDPRLAELVQQAMLEGHNQYAPMIGVPLLREQISQKIARYYGVAPDPETEVTITLGATEAIFSAIQALAGAGDEVIVFDPSYDSYEPAIQLAGARCLHARMLPPVFRPDWDEVRSLLSNRTRLVIINSPQNPACTCLSASDLQTLAELLRGRDCRVLSDEVYEHVVFDGQVHQSVLAHAELRERSVAVYSFGKTLHATGMRIGYAIAPGTLSTELRKVHQFNTFSIPTSLQQAIALYLRERPDCGRDLPAFFQAKRDLLAGLLKDSALQVIPAAGTYFQLMDYSAVADESDATMAERLARDAGVATIPLSVFYREPPKLRLLRLCFAKRDATLEAGAQRLLKWADGTANS
jgi:methionine aminotransferase